MLLEEEQSKQTKLKFDAENTMTKSTINTKEKIDLHILGKLSVLFNRNHIIIITNQILDLIVRDLQPFRIVDDVGFRSLISSAFPLYKICSRQFYTNQLHGLYEKVRLELSLILAETKNIALTSDCWSSRVPDSYMTITCHFIHEGKLKDYVLDTKCFGKVNHTGENLATVFKAVTLDWKIMDKIVATIVDNAANVKSAVNLSGFELICCMAHTLQLAIRDVIDSNEKIKKLLSKCRSIVGHFKRSNISKAKLKEAQVELKLPEHKLIQEVNTYIIFYVN